MRRCTRRVCGVLLVGVAMLTFTLAIVASARADQLPAMHQSRVLAPGVVELSATVRTGPGRYDRIGLHRVTTARASRSHTGVLLAHGDAFGFDSAFLSSLQPGDSLPVLLARRGIDVWGIDFGWTLVPREETDFTFMRDWGLQRDVDDLRLALKTARALRAGSGAGNARLSLLGWSRGGWTGYGLLDQEATLPPSQREAGAFVSVDNLYKTDNADTRELLCSSAESLREAIAGGDYVADNTAFADLGTLAETDPDAESPIFGPPYTNLQASLTEGAAPFQFGSSFTPWYHFVAGEFPDGDTTQIPTGLRFTSVARWNRLLATGSPYEPLKLVSDASAVSCADGSTPTFDAHLGQVRVPVMYLGAAGGFGTYGLYTPGLLGTHDVTTTIVRRRPPGQEKTDFGHVDLFKARDADRLVWQPIANWLLHHHRGH
jgi:hypothetical protein